VEDLLAVARKASRVLAAVAGNRFSLDELEAEALWGVALAIRDYDESRGTLRAYAAVRARGAVLDAIRGDPERHGRYATARVHHVGLGNEEEYSALHRAAAPEVANDEAVHDLLRRIRLAHSPKDAAIIAIVAEGGSYDSAARALGITPEAVYRRLRLVRRGDIGRELARRFGFNVSPTGAMSKP
jgi:DNA-directed RNA polymerase specialized sigma24 family protein